MNRTHGKILDEGEEETKGFRTTKVVKRGTAREMREVERMLRGALACQVEKKK